MAHDWRHRILRDFSHEVPDRVVTLCEGRRQVFDHGAIMMNVKLPPKFIRSQSYDEQTGNEISARLYIANSGGGDPHATVVVA